MYLHGCVHSSADVCPSPVRAHASALCISEAQSSVRGCLDHVHQGCLNGECEDGKLNPVSELPSVRHDMMIAMRLH